ncbi:hypothetical protein NM208_g3332 [Fusarium decemcellulare]|uniref:Uncharacterized protein n=2 Tax=Fusarium decemcellulare TaxID=57161 RepID=A0ACC1SPW0_9HYPO|nr:hypothetical protein NM208_g9109 [Fusarium decemcellulare]KAJ3543905.1 hypothetical protein NM208_g3332 [Fusarium decemcellulare]
MASPPDTLSLAALFQLRFSDSPNITSFEKLSIVAFRLLEASAAKLQTRSTKGKEKLLASQAELDSLKQQVKSLINERERLSQNHNTETKKAAEDDERLLAL